MIWISQEPLDTISQTVEYLKKEFEMKDLGKQSFVWDYSLSTLTMKSLCIKYYIQKRVLKRFNMDQSHPLSSTWA